MLGNSPWHGWWAGQGMHVCCRGLLVTQGELQGDAILVAVWHLMSVLVLVGGVVVLSCQGIWLRHVWHAARL